MPRKVSLLLLSTSLLVFTGIGSAQKERTSSRLAVPTGPIKVTSQRAEIDEQSKRMLYRGNVRMISGILELQGERLELHQPQPGQFDALVSGRPARLVQQAQKDAPQLSASAAKITYDTRAATLNLSGEATLTRGEDILTGDTIRYDLRTRRISATGTSGEQIKFVIQPPKDKNVPVDANPTKTEPSTSEEPAS